MLSLFFLNISWYLNLIGSYITVWNPGPLLLIGVLPSFHTTFIFTLDTPRYGVITLLLNIGVFYKILHAISWLPIVRQLLHATSEIIFTFVVIQIQIQIGTVKLGITFFLLGGHDYYSLTTHKVSWSILSCIVSWPIQRYLRS